MPLTLTPHQQEALDWLVTRLTAGADLVALRGYAGTGKTTVIPALRAALEHQGLTAVVGSPTHRAAMILRRKGISDADTLHAHALTPYFTADYARAMAWYGEIVPCRLGEEPHPDVDDLPWLVHEYGKHDLATTKATRRHAGRIKAKKLLASLGIHGKDCFAGFGPKQGQGVLIIDEASMVGQKMLALCQEAFHHIVLVGDPGQLPPVKDTAMLTAVEGVELTEIHRQAADSPILQLAYRARQGEPFWHGSFTQCSRDLAQSDVVEIACGDAVAFLEAPLIVWRNATRKTCTQAIRQALGFAKAQLYPGEPLVCRSTSPEDLAEGFYNNGLYRIVDVNTTDSRLVTVEDALGEASTICVHVEELDGEQVPFNAIPFRFGYCLTAHTAQGGEWPTVYISQPDMLKFAGMCQRYGRQDELAQWAYTAITRAKDMLCFLTHHYFERHEGMAAPKEKEPKLAPPSTPMLQDWTPTAADDIADPPVPVEALQETAQNAPESSQLPDQPEILPTGPPAPPDALWRQHEALVQSCCNMLIHNFHQALQDAVNTADKIYGSILQTAGARIETQAAANEHAQYQFSSALEQLLQHGLTTAPPYQATVQALSPAGFPVTLTITKRDTQDLIAALPALMGWLQEQQYRPLSEPSYA